MNPIDTIRTKDGDLPAFAWPGGYPILYQATEGGDTLCPHCANVQDKNPDADEVAAYFVFYEGAPEFCVDCGQMFESAYGDPEEPEKPTLQDVVGAFTVAAKCHRDSQYLNEALGLASEFGWAWEEEDGLDQYRQDRQKRVLHMLSRFLRWHLET